MALVVGVFAITILMTGDSDLVTINAETLNALCHHNYKRLITFMKSSEWGVANLSTWTRR